MKRTKKQPGTQDRGEEDLQNEITDQPEDGADALSDEPLPDMPDADEQADHLGEWLEKCTISRCSPESSAHLAWLGQCLFRRYISALGIEGSASDILNAGADGGSTKLQQRPWHLFESYMCAPGKGDRKRYKENLIAKCADASDTMVRVKKAVSYIKFCFRTVVRQWAAKEAYGFRNASGHLQAETVSEAQFTQDGDTVESIYDFIPDAIPDWEQESNNPLQEHAAGHLDPAAEAVQKDLKTIIDALAKDAAKEVLAAMDKAMRIALAARAYGISLANKEIVRIAGRDKSQLSLYLQTLDKKRAASAKSNIPALIANAVDLRLSPELIDLQTFIKAKTTECLLMNNRNWLARPENADLLRFLETEGERSL